jgi:hypothetical protein
MAVRTLTYRDLTAEQRRRGAKTVRERLMGVLSQPFITDDQRKAIYEKFNRLDHWERLALASLPPSPKQ